MSCLVCSLCVASLSDQTKNRSAQIVNLLECAAAAAATATATAAASTATATTATTATTTEATAQQNLLILILFVGSQGPKVLKARRTLW